jgi:hypothetical protein
MEPRCRATIELDYYQNCCVFALLDLPRAPDKTRLADPTASGTAAPVASEEMPAHKRVTFPSRQTVRRRRIPENTGF